MTNAALRNASRHDTTAGIPPPTTTTPREAKVGPRRRTVQTELTRVKYLGNFFLFEKRHPFILAGYRVSPHRHNWQGASTQCPFSRRFVVGSSHTQQLPFAVSSHTQPFA